MHKNTGLNLPSFKGTPSLQLQRVKFKVANIMFDRHINIFICFNVAGGGW